MPMAVVGVADMGMLMGHRLVAMLMGMPKGLIRGDSRQILWGMRVLMVRIAMARIVAVAMVVV